MERIFFQIWANVNTALRYWTSSKRGRGEEGKRGRERGKEGGKEQGWEEEVCVRDKRQGSGAIKRGKTKTLQVWIS